MLERLIGVAALMLVLACSGRQAEPPAPGGDRVQQPPAQGDGSGSAALTGNQQEDEATIARLEREARALARADGCTSGGQCAALPVGAKACGGPRSYLPYCPLTTDEAALRARLGELERFEREFNARYGIVSDCMLVVEPAMAVVGGRCVAR